MIARGVRIELSSGVLHDWLARAATNSPEAIAIVAGTRSLTYGELLARVHALAATLAQRGVQGGDRVLIFGDNTLETVVGFWAVLSAGATSVIVSPLARGDRLGYLLQDTRASALLTAAALAPAFAEPAQHAPALKTVVVADPLPAETLAALPGGVAWEDAERKGAAAGASWTPPAVGPDALAAIIYTSGSTGLPKGVMHSHRSMRAAVESIVAYLELRPTDVVFGALPLAFGYGLLQVLASVSLGARLVLERGFAFPAHVLGRIAAERVTCVAAVPSVFTLLGGIQSDADVSSVRIVTNAAAPLNARQAELATRIFPAARFFSMYGQTECLRGTYLPPDRLTDKRMSIGLPIPNCDAWVVDEQRRPVALGETGELVLSGPNVMLGYWERPDATAAKLQSGERPGERVLFTGDLARFDPDGFLYFVSRTDDIIKSRGEKVSPKEVEAAIAELPAVREAAVVGIEDELLGQAVKAFVVLEPGTTLNAREVQRHCQARLEGYMVPKHVVFIADLPRTSNGKVARNELR
jgi:amino acid adenylation domain-containing protein